MNAFSYGGGAQSTAALVLAAQGAIPYPLFLFANVGDDAEHPATLRYVREIAMPYAEANGVELVELRKVLRDGTPDSLMARIDRSQKSLPLPIRMANGAPGNRTCTAEFKIKVVAKELKRRGATKHDPATIGLGITMDEFQRMRSESGIAWELLAYPLIDRRMDRQDCVNVIERAGLPVPPKSSCYFCPFHRIGRWREMARTEPDLFAKSVALERKLNERRDSLGKDHVYLTMYGKPLDAVVSDDGQLPMDLGGCESAYCHL